MGVKLAAALGGSVELVPTNTASNYTATMPANTGTVVTTGSTAVVSQVMLAANVAGNGPAFSAYPSSGQSVSSSVYTKVLFQNEEWDTNNNFASSTFTPTVAGYYNLNATVSRTGGAFTGESVLVFYKNGSPARYVYDLGGTSYCLAGSTNLYMNGTTDYVEVYMYQVTGTVTLYSTANIVNFSGFLARAA